MIKVTLKKLSKGTHSLKAKFGGTASHGQHLEQDQAQGQLTLLTPR